jgi:hypothetical protein
MFTPRDDPECGQDVQPRLHFNALGSPITPSQRHTHPSLKGSRPQGKPENKIDGVECTVQAGVSSQNRLILADPIMHSGSEGPGNEALISAAQSVTQFETKFVSLET